MNYSHLGMLFLGLVIAAVGIPNLKGSISTIHWYNRSRVSEKDAPKYGKLMGLGTIVIGLCVALSGLIQIFVDFPQADYIVIAGLVAGLGTMLYAQFKYNGGIF